MNPLIAVALGRVRNLLTQAAPALFILLFWVGTLGATFLAGKHIGQTGAELEQARLDLAAARERDTAQLKALGRLLSDRQDIDKMARALDKRTRDIHQHIQDTIARDGLEAWYKADIHDSERAALYGLPTRLPAGIATPDVRPEPDPAHPPAGAIRAGSAGNLP